MDVETILKKMGDEVFCSACGEPMKVGDAFRPSKLPDIVHVDCEHPQDPKLFDW